MAVSSLTWGRCLSVLIKIWKGLSWVEKPVMPRRVRNWLMMTAREEPVMKVDKDVMEMRSTIQPKRRRTDGEQHAAGNDRQGQGNSVGRDILELGARRDVLDGGADDSGQDSSGAYRYVLGSAEYPVGYDTHKGRVQTKLGLELGQDRIGRALRNNDGADGDAGDDVASEPLEVVAADPGEEGEEGLGESGCSPGRGQLGVEPLRNGRGMLAEAGRLGGGEADAGVLDRDLELDAEHLGQRMAGLCRHGRCRHGGRKPWPDDAGPRRTRTTWEGAKSPHGRQATSTTRKHTSGGCMPTIGGPLGGLARPRRGGNDLECPAGTIHLRASLPAGGILLP